MITFSVLFTMAHKVEQYAHYFKTIRIVHQIESRYAI